jgi:hypothetical protein
MTGDLVAVHLLVTAFRLRTVHVLRKGIAHRIEIKGVSGD